MNKETNKREYQGKKIIIWLIATRWERNISFTKIKQNLVDMDFDPKRDLKSNQYIVKTWTE